MLAVRISFAYFSVSSVMSFPKSAGESASTSPPTSASRAFSLGSASAALISLLSLSTISAGVFRGAPRPYTVLASYPETNSPTVGIYNPVTARPRRAPRLGRGVAGSNPATPTNTWHRSVSQSRQIARQFRDRRPCPHPDRLAAPASSLATVAGLPYFEEARDQNFGFFCSSNHQRRIQGMEF